MILSIFSYFFTKNVSFNPIESKKYFCFESSIQNDISFSNHVERLFRIDNASNYRTKCVRFIIQKHHIIITSKSHHNHIILWNIDIFFVFKLQTIAMVTKWYSMAKKMNDSFKFSNWEFYYVKCFILFSFRKMRIYIEFESPQAFILKNIKSYSNDIAWGSALDFLIMTR